MTDNFNQEHDPYLESIKDLIDEHSKIIEELRSWQSKTSGGLAVAMWGFGIAQAIMFLVITLSVNSMVKTSDTISAHAVGLAQANQKMESFMAQGPRFTAEMNSASEAKLQADVQEWVMKNIPPLWVTKALESHEIRIKDLETK